MLRIFPRRLSSGGTFNNRLLFENNRLFFPVVFWKFLWGDKVLMEWDTTLFPAVFINSPGTGCEFLDSDWLSFN